MIFSPTLTKLFFPSITSFFNQLSLVDFTYLCNSLLINQNRTCCWHCYHLLPYPSWASLLVLELYAVPFKFCRKNSSSEDSGHTCEPIALLYNNAVEIHI